MTVAAEISGLDARELARLDGAPPPGRRVSVAVRRAADTPGARP